MYNLPNWPDRIDDRSTGRIAHEPGEWLEVTGALGIVRKREDEGCFGGSPVIAACKT